MFSENLDDFTQYLDMLETKTNKFYFPNVEYEFMRRAFEIENIVFQQKYISLFLLEE